MIITYIPIKYKEAVDGSWLDKARHFWEKFGPGLVLVEPEPMGDSLLTAAVENFLDTNGTYKEGDRVVIHARKDALPMGVEIAYQCQIRGIEPKVIFSYNVVAKELLKLIQSLPDFKDIGSAKPELLSNLIDQYRGVVEEVAKYKNGHWIVPSLPPEEEPSDHEKVALGLFESVSTQGLSKLTEFEKEGHVKSRDILAYPVKRHADKLGITLEEWRKVFFDAMTIQPHKIAKEIYNLEFLDVLVNSSIEGKTIEIKGKNGTKLKMSLNGRPLIKEMGTVGYNTIEGTGNLYLYITNLYAGELFCAPVEESFDGKLVVLGVPLDDPRGKGTVEDYEIIWDNGKIVSADAKKGKDILLEMVGLLDRGDTGDKLKAYELRQRGAELGIGLVNPVIKKFAERYKNCIIPSVGFGHEDEKNMKIHIGHGENDHMGGKTPSKVGNFSVDHGDFPVNDFDEICLV
jgi:leucyl aminopeptidase (aminopeptidase T)